MKCDNQETKSIDVELMHLFDQMASSYDSKRYHSHGSSFINEIERHIVKEWALGDSETMTLDIPCGTGRLMISLAHRCEKVFAVDISAGMLSIAKERAKRAVAKNVAFLRANARKLPFPKNTFDTIICFNFLHLIPNEQKGQLMREFDRVLKPSGRIILELNSPFYGLLLGLVEHRPRLREFSRVCFFPGQGRWLFRDYRQVRAVGIGFPLFWLMARIFGKNVMMKISLVLGSIPVLQFLAYAIIFELHKDKQS